MSDIRYVDDTPPDLTGAQGKAWKRDTVAIWKRHDSQGAAPELTVADWIVEATYAHPLWHSYHLICFALRPHPSVQGDTRIYLPGATHEFVLHALEPDNRRAIDDAMNWLQPANFAAQIIAASDEEARERMELAVIDILAGTLSPDTDYRRMWMHRFGDNMIKPQWRDAPEGMVIIEGEKATVIGTGAGVAKALGMQSAGVIRGKNYRPVTHRDGCAAAPWDECPCQ